MTQSVPPAMSKSEAWYWRLRRRITPGLLNAQYAYFDKLDELLKPGDRWLDLGCGRRLSPSWMRQSRQRERRLITRADEVVGIDPDGSALADNTLAITKHKGLAQQVPEPDRSFDLITANMVFEHVDDPGAVLAESARLLKPGGVLLFHTPNIAYPVTRLAACVPIRLRHRLTAWLEKRPTKDIYPTHYRLNRADTIHDAAYAAGLITDEIHRTADSPETVRLGPFVAFELGLIALTRTKLLSGFRSNLLVILRKPIDTTASCSTPVTTTEANLSGTERTYGAAA